MRVVLTIIGIAILVALAFYYRDSLADKIAKRQEIEVVNRMDVAAVPGSTTPTPVASATPTPIPSSTPTPTPRATATPVGAVAGVTTTGTKSIADTRASNEPLPTTGPELALIPLLGGLGGWGAFAAYRRRSAGTAATKARYEAARKGIEIR